MESVETVFNCIGNIIFCQNFTKPAAFYHRVGTTEPGRHDEPGMGCFLIHCSLVPAESYPANEGVSDFGRPIHLCHFASEMDGKTAVLGPKNLEVDRFKKALQGGLQKVCICLN